MAASSEPTRNPWQISTREVVYMAIGGALYGVLAWGTSLLRLPGPFNVQLRPAIVIPMFFGGAFGPMVGFFTGAIGNIIADLLSGYGFSWNWSLANGLLGLIAGLSYVRNRLEGLPKPRAVVGWSIAGTILAFLFSSVADIWVYQTQPKAVPLQYVQVVVPNIIFAAVLLPILYAAYQKEAERGGH